MLCAAPEMADPMAKVTMNPKRTAFLPNTDARLPTKGGTAVDAMAQGRPANTKSVPCSSPTIVGSAIAIAVYEAGTT